MEIQRQQLRWSIDQQDRYLTMGLHSENEVSYFWYKTGTDINNSFSNGVAAFFQTMQKSRLNDVKWLKPFRYRLLVSTNPF